MSALCSVIIINWNGMKYVKPCFESVKKQTHKDIETIVIDNKSIDGSREYIKQYYPDSIVIENNKNVGFAAAMNQGIKASKGEYILALNLDATINENFVEEMILSINTSPDIGSASGKLLLAQNQDLNIIDTTGHIMYINRLPVNRGSKEEDHGQYNKSDQIFGTCAAAALYKRKMLEDIKILDEYFDESFFANFEDVDLDWRAQIYGWKCIYTPTALGYHHRNTFNSGRHTKLLFTKNRLISILKNENALMLLHPFHLYFYLSQLITVFVDYFTNKEFKIIIDEILANFSIIIKKRRIIQKNRKASIGYIKKLYKPVAINNSRLSNNISSLVIIIILYTILGYKMLLLMTGFYLLKYFILFILNQFAHK